MIRHMVLVRFVPETTDDERHSLFRELDALRNVVPGMGRFHAGGNLSPESLNRGYTHAFTIEFDDRAARDRYLVHPAHKAAGARLVNATAGGVDGLLVFDLHEG